MRGDDGDLEPHDVRDQRINPQGYGLRNEETANEMDYERVEKEYLRSSS